MRNIIHNHFMLCKGNPYGRVAITGNNSVIIDFETEILIREIATAMFRDVGKVEGRTCPAVAEAKAELYSALDNLSNLVDKDIGEQAFDLEDKINNLASFEHEEYFVNGFVKGYFYLRHIMKSQEAAFLLTADEGRASK